MIDVDVDASDDESVDDEPIRRVDRMLSSDATSPDRASFQLAGREGFLKPDYPESIKLLHERVQPPRKPNSISSTGKTFPVVDDRNWRVKIQKINNIVLDDEAKGRYIDYVRKYGKKGLAAAWAGVTVSTVRKHLEVDPEFREAADQALLEHRENKARKLEQQAMNGYEETIIGADGTMATRRRYETPLRALILRASDRDMYDEKKEGTTINLGALVIPATMDSDSWERQFDCLRDKQALPIDARDQIAEDIRNDDHVSLK